MDYRDRAKAKIEQETGGIIPTQAMIDAWNGLTFKGPWAAGTYAGGDYVTSGGNTYRRKSPGTDTVFNVAQWDITAQGGSVADGSVTPTKLSTLILNFFNQFASPSRSGFLFVWLDSAGRRLAGFRTNGTFTIGNVDDVGGKVAQAYTLTAGPASGAGSSVTTPGGPARTNARLTTEMQAVQLIGAVAYPDTTYNRSGYAIPFLDSVGRVFGGWRKGGDLFVKGKGVDARLTALESSNGQNPGFDLAINGLATVECNGDSLTYGVGGTSYPSQLATLLGRTVAINAVPGQSAAQIATRQGGIVSLLTITNNTIPASGAVAVTVRTQSPIDANGPGPMTGILAGVPGTLARLSDDSYTFTRTASGAAKGIDPATPFWVDRSGKDYWIQIIWAGRNNVANVSFATEVKTAVAAMVAQMKAANKKFIVLSVLNASDEGTGTARYTAITALNEELKSLYPYNYIDVRRVLIRGYNSGNSADVTDVANDVVPTSLRSDTVHLTTAGYGIVAGQVYNFITLKNW